MYTGAGFLRLSLEPIAPVYQTLEYITPDNQRWSLFIQTTLEPIAPYYNGSTQLQTTTQKPRDSHWNGSLELDTGEETSRLKLASKRDDIDG